MNHRSTNRSGRTMTALVILVCLTAAIGAGFVFLRGDSQDDSDRAVLIHKVGRSDFEAFVMEPGDVASSSNVDIRCRVKAPGAAGTPILTIIEEGTEVKIDDELIKFDDSLLQNEVLAQQIAVANNRAALTQAESDLATAQHTLREFEKGLFQQEVELLESEIFVAEENLGRSEATLAHSKRLAGRGFITLAQQKADEFAVEKAKKDLAAARRKLDVYQRFTYEKTIGEYQAEIKKQEENVKAAEFTLKLSQQKLEQIDEQIAQCRVLAPAKGQVVYHTDPSRGDTPEVIEEGTLVRENQIVIRLPDLKNMHVDVKINESHVNRIQPGQLAEIILDADPEKVLRGKVKEVAPYPFPVRWHGAPMEYGTVVTIIDPPPTIRPGLRAKVKIIFESQSDVLQVPLAAVIEQGEQHYCLVRDQDGWHPQPVRIGSNNNTQVIVLEGLSEDDQVSLTPFRHIERSDLPGVDPSEIAGDKRSRQRATSPAVSGTAAKAAPAS